MKLWLKASGGFANLELSGELDSAELPPELVERHLTEEGLEAATAVATEAVNPYATDSMLYELTIEGEGEPPETFRLDDSTTDPELVDTLAMLMREIVRRKQAALSGGEEE